MNNTSFTKPWALCIGSDRVSTMLRSEYWEHFKTLQSIMPVLYIRCHGLLGDELGVVRSIEHEGKKHLVYNFTYLDQIFDTMLSHNVRPYIEWGFMPKAIASGEQAVFWWQGNVTPPSNFDEWAHLLKTLTEHWIERYGKEEVISWPNEIWNEPNLEVFWKDADQKAYFKLFEVSVRTLKGIDSRIQVGGPAICGGSDHWIDDFLSFIKERDLPLDNFTRHLYTAEPPVKQSPEFLYHFLSPAQKPIDELDSVRKRIDSHGFSGVPLHITEFNTSYNPRCLVHDSAFNAAYLARLLAEAGKYTTLMSFWTFCDVFEEADVPRALFHGGFGLIGRWGIKKPTFYLFEFFSKLSSSVVHQDETSIASIHEDGSITLIAWNSCPKDSDNSAVCKTVTLDWKKGSALAVRQRISEDFCNPWKIWKEMGRPVNPRRKLIDCLKKEAVPHIETALISSDADKISVAMTLGKNEVSCIEISVFNDESGSYIGLDDNNVDGYTNEINRNEQLS